MAKAKVEKVTSGQVFEALREKYGRSAVVIAEVPNATGYRNTVRRLDAVAVGCWPSRGLYFHGIEIKVSRSDLRRELNKPEKAEAIAAYCDSFWIACPKGLCDPEEIPEAWGLYELAKGKIKIAKHPTGEATREVDRDWVAALVRAVVEQQSDETVLAKRESAAKREAWAEAQAHYEESNEKLHAEARAAHEELHRFKRVLQGFRYGSKATPEQLAVVMRALDSLRGDFGALNSLRVSARTIVEQADAIENAAKGIFAEEESDAPAEV